MSEMTHSPENDQSSPKQKSKSLKSPISPRSPKASKSPKPSPTKSPTRTNLTRGRSVRKMIAEREKEMKASGKREQSPHKSTPATRSASPRRQKSSRSRGIKSEVDSTSDSPIKPRRQKSLRSKSGAFAPGTAKQDDEKSLISTAQTVAVPNSDSPVAPRRRKSLRSKSGAFPIGGTANQDDEKSLISTAQTVAAPSSPRRVRSSSGVLTENVVPQSSSRQYPQSPKPRTRRLHTASLRRLATEERGHDSMKASASVASASVSTLPVLHSSASTLTTARSTALRKPFRDTPSRRRAPEVAPGTPRKRPQKTESVQSVQARIRQLNASFATLG